jgi:hypothetical protein
MPRTKYKGYTILEAETPKDIPDYETITTVEIVKNVAGKQGSHLCQRIYCPTTLNLGEDMSVDEYVVTCAKVLIDKLKFAPKNPITLNGVDNL